MIRCVGSGSSGNSYALIDNDNKILLLDLGLPAKEIKRAIDFRISDVVGAVVTHHHKDHSLAVADFEKMGIPVWQPYLDENKMQRRYFGGFMVRSFDVPHDNEPCVGYLIECPNHDRLLYATDCEYIRYSFKKMNLSHILIECNYQQELVDRDLPNYEHKIRGHCSLDTCKEFIKVNSTDSLQTVILCHLGQETTEPMECVADIQKIVPWANVCVAEKGLEVELRNKNECPF